ncbi:MAG: methylase [Myxococcota bacterium]
MPWSEGYLEFRNDLILDVLRDSQLLDNFRSNGRLPADFGSRLDERVIEYPWAISRLDGSTSPLLDAGSALNHRFLIDHPVLQKKSIVFYTLSPESFHDSPNLSYIFGDLRATILKSEIFHEIVCISTLEHIGMDNTKLYTSDPQLKEQNPTDYRCVMKEFQRLLIPGGRLILTVPFGRPADYGWLQVFDSDLLDDAISSFAGEMIDEAFYQHTTGGWILSDREGCKDCKYFDIHREEIAPDYAAAARGVACLELRRSLRDS